jgi:hypothetical protein
MYQKCTKTGCILQSGSVVIDRELQTVTNSSGKNYLKTTSAQIESAETVSKAEKECDTKCRLDSFDYEKASISTSASAPRLGFMNTDNSVGSRVYLLNETAGRYFNIKMVDHEVGTSTFLCRTNGPGVFFGCAIGQ